VKEADKTSDGAVIILVTKYLYFQVNAILWFISLMFEVVEGTTFHVASLAILLHILFPFCSSTQKYSAPSLKISSFEISGTSSIFRQFQKVEQKGLEAYILGTCTKCKRN